VGGLDFEKVAVEKVSYFVGNDGAKFELCAHSDLLEKVEYELEAAI
jgi:hypothetical protein